MGRREEEVADERRRWPLEAKMSELKLGGM